MGEPLFFRDKLPRYWAKRLADFSWPTLIIVKGKHEDAYFLAGSPQGLYYASLQILENNLNAGNYYKPDRPKKGNGLTAEQIASLPKEYQKQELALVKAREYEQRRYEEDLDEWNSIQEALATRNGMLAFQILDHRGDHEYEGFSLQAVEHFE